MARGRKRPGKNPGQAERRAKQRAAAEHTKANGLVVTWMCGACAVPRRLTPRYRVGDLQPCTVCKKPTKCWVWLPPTQGG